MNSCVLASSFETENAKLSYELEVHCRTTNGHGTLKFPIKISAPSIAKSEELYQIMYYQASILGKNEMNLLMPVLGLEPDMLMGEGKKTGAGI